MDCEVVALGVRISVNFDEARTLTAALRDAAERHRARAADAIIYGVKPDDGWLARARHLEGWADRLAEALGDEHVDA